MRTLARSTDSPSHLAGVPLALLGAGCGIGAICAFWMTLAASPLLADDVHLKNGRSFEGVVAEVGETQVRVQMPGGSISLPRSAVDRVEKSETSFSEYLERKQAIESREAKGRYGDDGGNRRAADWLELARWARRSGYSQGAREAALTAAEIDPRLPGLASLLRPFGYVYEERLDRWVSYDDSMRLHGFVQDGGQWINRDEARARGEQRLQLQAALAAQQAAAAATEARDLELLRAQMEIAQQAQGGGGGGYAYDPGYGLGGFYGGLGWPGFVSPTFGPGAYAGFGAFGFGGRMRGFQPRGFEHRGHQRGFEPERRGIPFRQSGGLPPARLFSTPRTTGVIRH